MDVVSQVVIFVLLIIYIQSRKNELKEDKRQQSLRQRDEWGYFLFGEDNGLNQLDDDPFLSDEYDNGPGWDDYGDGDWG